MCKSTDCLCSDYRDVTHRIWLFESGNYHKLAEPGQASYGWQMNCSNAVLDSMHHTLPGWVQAPGLRIEDVNRARVEFEGMAGVLASRPVQ